MHPVGLYVGDCEGHSHMSRPYICYTQGWMTTAEETCGWRTRNDQSAGLDNLLSQKPGSLGTLMNDTRTGPEIL